jgi:hypothetical protein
MEGFYIVIIILFVIFVAWVLASFYEQFELQAELQAEKERKKQEVKIRAEKKRNAEIRAKRNYLSQINKIKKDLEKSDYDTSKLSLGFFTDCRKLSISILLLKKRDKKNMEEAKELLVFARLNLQEFFLEKSIDNYKEVQQDIEDALKKLKLMKI